MGWFELYLLTLLPELKDTVGIFAVIYFIFAGALVIPYAITRDRCSWEGPPGDALKGFWAFCGNVWKRGVPVALIAMAVQTFIPGTKALMFIVGGSTLIEATKTDAAQRLANKSLQAVEAWLDEQTKEAAK